MPTRQTTKGEQAGPPGCRGSGSSASQLRFSAEGDAEVKLIHPWERADKKRKQGNPAREDTKALA